MSKSGLTVVSTEDVLSGASSTHSVEEGISDPVDPAATVESAPRLATVEPSQGASEEYKEVAQLSGNSPSTPEAPASFYNDSKYDGDLIDDTPPPNGEYQKFDFENPAVLVSFFNSSIAQGEVTLHPWQIEVSTELGNARPTSQDPFKYCLVAANGSGKDNFILAPFAVWFALTKIRSRVIITTSSGTQLTSQTEPYINDLCKKVNAFFGQEVFRIRQRYIKCLLTGSEIRMFATDEAGRAEGYHPMDPNREMAIIVNEGKSVTEDIHRALRRCSGFNYWLEVSSTGEPKGYFYTAATTWKHVRYITSYECPHISQAEIEEDKKLDGEHSAFFRSKHLSQFTSIGGQIIIPLELINDLKKKKDFSESNLTDIRIGIDLAAGGDENAICFIKGNKVIKEVYFRETDTVVTFRRIAHILGENGISKKHEFIYADDGGVGKSIIDMLVDQGWSINRVMNQWAPLGNKKQYGNRGAENWYRVKRILEERAFDITGLSEKTIEQLHNRYYKQNLTGGRIFLESKKEAKAEGRPSPDRADAFILAFSGLTVEDFIEAEVVSIKKLSGKPRTVLTTPTEVEEHYENTVTFQKFNLSDYQRKQLSGGRRVNGSLRNALKNN